MSALLDQLAERDAARKQREEDEYRRIVCSVARDREDVVPGRAEAILRAVGKTAGDLQRDAEVVANHLATLERIGDGNDLGGEIADLVKRRNVVGEELEQTVAAARKQLAELNESLRILRERQNTSMLAAAEADKSEARFAEFEPFLAE